MVDTNIDRVTVKWGKPKSDGGSPVTGYVIDICSPPSIDFTTLGKVDQNTDTYTAEGLTKGKKYYFRVRAENPAGLSEPGAELKRPAVAKLPYGK